MESRPDMLPVGQRMGAPESDNLPAQVLRIDAVEHPTAADWMHPLSVCQPVPPPLLPYLHPPAEEFFNKEPSEFSNSSCAHVPGRRHVQSCN